MNGVRRLLHEEVINLLNLDDWHDHALARFFVREIIDQRLFRNQSAG